VSFEVGGYFDGLFKGEILSSDSFSLYVVPADAGGGDELLENFT
jgi:hypothetical protein